MAQNFEDGPRLRVQFKNLKNTVTETSTQTERYVMKKYDSALMFGVHNALYIKVKKNCIRGLSRRGAKTELGRALSQG